MIRRPVYHIYKSNWSKFVSFYSDTIQYLLCAVSVSTGGCIRQLVEEVSSTVPHCSSCTPHAGITTPIKTDWHILLLSRYCWVFSIQPTRSLSSTVVYSRRRLWHSVSSFSSYKIPAWSFLLKKNIVILYILTNYMFYIFYLFYMFYIFINCDNYDVSPTLDRLYLFVNKCRGV